MRQWGGWYWGRVLMVLRGILCFLGEHRCARAHDGGDIGLSACIMSAVGLFQ